MADNLQRREAEEAPCLAIGAAKEEGRLTSSPHTAEEDRSEVTGLLTYSTVPLGQEGRRDSRETPFLNAIYVRR